MKHFEHILKRIFLSVFSIFLLFNLAEGQGEKLGALYNSSYSQEGFVVEKGANLKEAINQLEEQYGVVFLYRSGTLDNKTVKNRKQFYNAGIEEALDGLLKGQDLVSEYLNPKTYGIYAPRNRPAFSEKTEVRQEKITGTVTDASSGQTLPGVNIIVMGTTRGTSTDSQGNFTLTVPSLQDTLMVSYVGFQNKQVPINGRTELNIELRPEAVSGEELVVVGYGTQRKQDLTGSVGQVSSENIAEQPVNDITEALQGAAGNLTIQQPSGAPGAEMNINIRGVSTMNNNDPLVVIDGVVGGSLSNLDPKNIENISVLKDAGSAAIYGSRAANGVILVTTKSGQKNTEPTFSFSNKTGYNVPNIRYEPVDGYKNAILRNQAAVNSGNSPIYSPEQIRTMKREGDIEWFMDTIFQEALQQEYNLSVSGGSDNTTYRISTRYFNQENNFVGDYGMKRYNIRANVNTEYGIFDVNSKVSFQRSDITNHATSTFFTIADAKRTPPYYNYQMQAENGRYLINDVLTQFNPLGELKEGGSNESTNDVFTGVLEVSFDITDNLEARGNFSSVIHSDQSLFKRKEVRYYASATAENYASVSGSERNTNNDNYRSITINPRFVLDYTETFGDAHNVDGLLGVSNESFTSESNGIHLIYTDPDLNIPTSETEIQNSSYTTLETRTENSLYSAFGRAKYNYDQKYFFEFNFRYDGSSKFAEDNRWGFFPSASVAWSISKEDFLEDYRNNVGDLKLRASYGTLGNQSVGNYQYQTSYFIYSNAYAFNNSSVSGTGFEFANEDLKWETTTTLNVGADASFFDGRLDVSLDAYEKVTSDILVTPTVPGTYGGAVPNYNAGEMRNRGWEASINYNSGNEDFNQTIGFNISDTWNEVTDYVGEEEINSSDQMQRIIREGEAYNSYYGYKVDGFFQNMQEVQNGPTPTGISVKPGDVRYKDKNNDGVIDDDDRYVLGNAFPRYTFGLNYGLNWKNFDLSLMIQGVLKRTMFLRGENVEPFHANYAYTMYTHQKDFWTPTNPDARWPRLSMPGSASNTNNYQMSSDLYAFDASYARLKNVKIGYTLPKRYSLGAKNIYIYVNGRNLYTLTDMDFYNPEGTEFNNDMNAGGANSGRSYPELRYYGFGVQLEL